MVDGLMVIGCWNCVLVLPWLINACCCSVGDPTADLQLWVYGCLCIEEKGGHENKVLG